MKITFNLHDTLLQEAKIFAAQQQLTLTRLVEDGLRMRLRAGAAPAKASRRVMPVFDGKSGLVPGLSGLSTREMPDKADAG